ncbi:restriction endonuclease subunit S [Enterococcus faecalis]|uniref:restriction endonuclease subunit S n=2 Tax=Enterococcus faecalis TaxID=1351 RepID=UPI00242AE6F8|nr:restriction endonuclease subunit S [Enterococcus faecalis]MDN3174056.1 restriction endonuclease subunit S [Enterococcus faecalis]
MKKVPRLRFRGFSEDWELCKLGQVANYRRGSFPQPYGNKEWYDGENSMPFVQVVDVGDNLRLVEDTKQKISELAQPKSVFVKEGKVVVTLQGSIGRVAITQYPAYVDRTLLIFESYKAEMDEYYFAYVIQQLFEYEKTRAPGGTIKTVTKEALSDFTISFPSIEEQKKLGKFFEQLDDTITLHQRKLDQLKKLKKAYLQAMFVSTNPKNNKVPKLRFTDFEGDWELCKLGVMAPLRGGFAFKSENFQNSGVRIVRISNIDKMGKIRGPYVYCQEQENDTNYLLPNNSVLLAMSGATTGKVAILSKRSKEKYYQNQRVGYFQKNIEYSYDFIAVLVQSDLFLKQLDSVLVSGAQPNISSTEINNFNFMIPKNVEEQNQIGIFIKNIDNTITFHQNKLTQLKSLKKSYLQNMFI